MADFDKKLADTLENNEVFLGIIKQLEEAATSTKIVQLRDVPCDKCGCKHFRSIEVPNYELKLKIMDWLANRGVGRPSQADSADDGEKITFIREVRK